MTLKGKRTDKPLVSVVTVFFNGEKFIRDAIESVFAQTYDHWELLLVDDGSDDGSSVIAQRYAEKHHERVIYLEHSGHQNLGQSASRNLGISNAKGEYIAFIDADDVWLPQKLEMQVAILGGQPEAGMVYGPSLYWYSWTGYPRDVRRDFRGQLGVTSNSLFDPPTLLTKFLKNAGIVPCISSLLVKRKIVEEVGGFDATIKNLYEDQVLLAKILLSAPVFVESGCWDKYRQHPNSVSSIAIRTGQYHPTKPNAAREAYLNWLAKYLSDDGYNDKMLRKSLQRALRPYRLPLFYHLAKLPQIISRKVKELWILIEEFVLRSLTGSMKRRMRPVNLARFHRVTPISRNFGYDRGTPVDRYYIEKFIGQYAADIQGHVLEIGDNTYTRKFGDERVTKSDVLHVEEGNPKATIVADLTSADHIPSDTFDCVILTQTLHLIYDVKPAVKTLCRILKPGGVVLATVPGISQIAEDQWGDYQCWCFTTLSIRRLFEEMFSTGAVEVKAHGNVLTAVAFLHGLAVEELIQEELEYHDPAYEVLIAARAVKSKV